MKRKEKMWLLIALLISAICLTVSLIGQGPNFIDIAGLVADAILAMLIIKRKGGVKE